MCKFIEFRVRRIENDIICDLAKLAENLDTLTRFYNCNAIQPKQAYKRAQHIARRFDDLLKRLKYAMNAADRFEAANNVHDPVKYYVSHKDYIKTCQKLWDGLEFFGL